MKLNPIEFRSTLSDTEVQQGRGDQQVSESDYAQMMENVRINNQRASNRGGYYAMSGRERNQLKAQQAQERFRRNNPHLFR